MEILRVENIVKSYPIVKALEDVSITIETDTTVCILGKKGSGKRTLVNIILGNTSPDSGNVFFKNENINKFSKRKRQQLGIISIENEFDLFDRFYNLIFPVRTVKDYLFRRTPSMSKWLNRKLNRNEKLEIINSALLSMHTGEIGMFRSIDQQYRGQKKRIELASCLIREPELLIIDDLFFGMDIYNQYECFKNLNKFSKIHNFAFVYSTDSSVPHPMCDKGYILDRGKLISEYTVDNNSINPGSSQSEHLSSLSK